MRRTAILITTLLLTSTLYAQNDTTFHFTFNHLALSVKNADSSAAFYKRVLHLEEITNRTKAAGIRWLSLGDGRELHLISTIKDPFTLNKAIHLGLAMRDFEAFVRWLDREKIPYSDWSGTPRSVTTRADGIKQVYFQDPDGYWIEVNNTGR